MDAAITSLNIAVEFQRDDYAETPSAPSARYKASLFQAPNLCHRVAPPVLPSSALFADEAKPVTKVACKLQAEINEITAKLENIKAKYEKLQVEHTKIRNAKKEVIAQPGDLEDRLQKVINELNFHCGY